MRRFGLLVGLAALTSPFVIVVAAAPPASASTKLSMHGSVFDVVVDGDHDHVFVSSGSGGSGVDVLDYSGEPVTTLSIAGASGMALVGSTLFVAAADADQIVAVDTATLAVADGSDLAPLTEPGSLAYVAGKLWFTTGACGSTVQHANIDTGGLHVSTPVTLAADTCPRYAASPVDPDVLLMFDEGADPMTLSEYDMSTTPPTLVLGADNPDGSAAGDDAVFAPDGASIVTAAESETSFGEAKTSDLTSVRSYVAAAAPDAVDVTAAGVDRLAGGSDTPDGDSVWVYDIGTSTATNTFDLPGDDTVVPHGIAWSDDGTAVFVVSRGSSSSALRLSAFDPDAVASTLTLSATPGSVTVGDRVTLQGTLTPDGASAVAGEKVTLFRMDATGTDRVGAATVALDGSYSLKDTVKVGGPTTYLARFGGSFGVKPSEATDTVTVAKLASHVSIKLSDAAVPFGDTVRITGHLGAGTRSRVLELYAKPDGGHQSLIKRAKVDAHGNLSASFSPVRDTTFTARFDGDRRHRSDEDHAVTRVRVIVNAKLTNFIATSGKYKIYRGGKAAPVHVHVSPNHAGFRVRVTLQGFVGGRWQPFDRGSFKLNAASNTSFVIQGSSNVNFRVQVKLPTHTDHLGDASPWLYLRFT
jgi:sugar lactone lactonase YvrE